MAKKSIKVFLEKEIDTIVDKTVGRTNTLAYIDSGAVWITLTKVGNKNEGGQTADQRVSTTLSVKELRTILCEIDPKGKGE